MMVLLIVMLHAISRFWKSTYVVHLHNQICITVYFQNATTQVYLYVQVLEALFYQDALNGIHFISRFTLESRLILSWSRKYITPWARSILLLVGRFWLRVFCQYYTVTYKTRSQICHKWFLVKVCLNNLFCLKRAVITFMFVLLFCV